MGTGGGAACETAEMGLETEGKRSRSTPDFKDKEDSENIPMKKIFAIKPIRLCRTMTEYI